MHHPSGRHAGPYSAGKSRHQNAQRTQTATPDVSQLASALKVRNFKTLLNASGSTEQLGIALDMPVARIEELARGERFTSEIAYHIETTLDLPSGFLDQVNPVLTDDVLKRLKSPEQYKFLDAEPPAPVNKVTETAAPAPETASAQQPQEVDMAKAPAPAPAVAAAPQPRRRRRYTDKEPEALTPEEQLYEQRRVNLNLLTSKPGSKGKLGELLGMSPANISHRLHGLKKLDDEQMAVISQALNMDAAWFDSPHSEADIPAHVAQLLEPGPKLPRGAKKAAREAAKAARAAQTGAAAPRAARKTATRVLAPADANMPRLSAGLVSAAPAPAPNMAAAAPKHSVRTEELAPADVSMPQMQPAAAPATVASLALVGGPAMAANTSAPLATAVAPSASGFVPALTDEDLAGLTPLAIALLKTLAVKARQGRLDDMRAIALLTEVAQL